MTMKLLVVGGPRHGELMSHQPSQREVRVPVMPPMSVSYPSDFTPAEKYCVHGGVVRSLYDGDWHTVPGINVAKLYRMSLGEYRLTPVMDPSHRASALCVYPDDSGRYNRDHLPPLSQARFRVTGPDIKVAIYNARIVSDRLVWVYVGE